MNVQNYPFELAFEPDEERLEMIKAYFANDIFIKDTVGIEVVAVAHEHCVMKMEIQKRHLNAKNGVQGGAIYTMADIAAAIANYEPEEKSATVEGTIQFLSLAKGSTLFANAHATKRGHTLGYYNVDIIDDTGLLVAVASITMMHRSK